MINCNLGNHLIKARLFFNIGCEGDSNKTNLKAFQNFIKNLIYLIYSIRLNIIFIIK